MKKILIGLISVALLSGCKVELAPTVNLSDVNSETAKTIQSKLVVEVMSCADYKDSRKESSDVTDAKEAISNIFTDAKYIECYREKMDSKALFEIPITVGGKDLTGDIQIRNGGFGGGMIVLLSDNLRSKIQQQQKNSFSKFEPSVQITIKNDLDKNQDIVVHGVLADAKHYLPYSWYQLVAGKAQTFKLSDVSVLAITKHGGALVYEDYDKRYQIKKE
ncbi:hypothetical protein J3U42_04635 [Gilliamella sp. B2923]|uniref:DUF7424 family protein n=1 Tax=unclassified Gilliamella TaxID=2685620 RepID=UPI001C6A4F94|nr:MULTISPECIES: hypothetical protein [unclassified Gilliamella]MCX8617674.1 hypothetical protein [Gilliamella sp. B2923]QYN46622.1 hypothetical protein GYM74_05160 [Gilliamella sp. ESL0405]